MSDFFGELMESIDSLTEEQVNALLSKLEVKRAGSRKVQEESKDEQEPMACPVVGVSPLRNTAGNRKATLLLQRLPQDFCRNK